MEAAGPLLTGLAALLTALAGLWVVLRAPSGSRGDDRGAQARAEQAEDDAVQVLREMLAIAQRTSAELAADLEDCRRRCRRLQTRLDEEDGT